MCDDGYHPLLSGERSRGRQDGRERDLRGLTGNGKNPGQVQAQDFRTGMWA